MTATRNKDYMTAGERAGEVFGIFFILLAIAFFAYHAVANTGFFASNFGLLEAFLFFTAGVVSLFAPMVRIITGRRSKARWFELGSAVLWSITSIWFLIVFPFNFEYLAVPLPSYLQFTLSWITNDIGRIILLLSAIGGVATTIYLSVRIAIERSSNQRYRYQPAETREKPSVGA